MPHREQYPESPFGLPDLFSKQTLLSRFGHLCQKHSRAHVDLIATTNIFKQGFPPETLITLMNKLKNQSVSI